MASNTTSVAIPETPVGGRVNWLLEALSPEHELTAEEVTSVFDELSRPASCPCGCSDVQFAPGRQYNSRFATDAVGLRRSGG